MRDGKTRSIFVVPPGPAAAPHPEKAQLNRLVRGALSREEARQVVRHLLTGCAECRRVTGWLWRLGDLPGEREPEPGTAHEKETRA